MVGGSGACACGIDFGTSNSTITVALEDGEVLQVALEGREGASPTLLYFGEAPPPRFGERAIRAYLEEEMSGRLIQSIKRHLPAVTFDGTLVLGRHWSIEELIASYLIFLKVAAEETLGRPITAALMGRPARFHPRDDRDALAQQRLESAAYLAGFQRIAFQLEPIAAARRFERSLTGETLCLVGDFGGGTSDFTVIRLSPGRAGRRDRSADVLGVAGVSVGGNDFDAQLMLRHVLPHFGHLTDYKPFDQWMPIPPRLHVAITRWHTACLAGTRENLAWLKEAMRTARDRQGLARLHELLEDGWFYLLFQAVEATKMALSSQEQVPFHFQTGTIQITSQVTRRDFEDSIREELQKLERCVDDLLASLGMVPGDIDTVFLTGGSSRVPAVRQLFEARFGSRIRELEALTSVGYGLGVEAGERLL